MSKVEQILSYFEELYPAPVCALNFSSSYELLVAVMLSAQCTDKRVNMVTKELFKVAKTPQLMLNLGQEKLKQIIYPCGFYNAKSKAIIETSKDLIEKFNGVVPNSMEELTTLKGVGRKTANVVMGVAFNKQTIAVDTHVHRISKRLGLCSSKSSPYDCEKSLVKIIPKNSHTKFHHQAIWFGREICKAQKPSCTVCKLKEICKYYNKG